MADTGQAGDRFVVVGPHGERETVVRFPQRIDIGGEWVAGMPILKTSRGVEVSQLADNPPGRYLINGVEYTVENPVQKEA